MNSLDSIQLEQEEWTKKNFPNKLPHHPLLGMAEELGELMHAHLKGEQGIRHTPDEIFSMKVDAIGDLVIYLLDYCNQQHIMLSLAIEQTWCSVKQRNWINNPKDGKDTQTTP